MDSLVDRSERRADASNAQLAGLGAAGTVDLAHQHRLLEQVAHLEYRVDRLEQAAMSNRQLGMALRVLATSRQISYLQAHDLLRDASRRSGRTMRDVAAEVAVSGGLAWPPAASTQRHPALVLVHGRRRCRR